MKDASSTSAGRFQVTTEGLPVDDYDERMEKVVESVLMDPMIQAMLQSEVHAVGLEDGQCVNRKGSSTGSFEIPE